MSRSPAERTERVGVPALIGVASFHAVAAVLAENRRRYREQKQGATFLLSGLLLCHRCGSAYCGRRSDRYVYYRCLGTDKYRHGGAALCTNPSVTGGVEEAVWSDLCALLSDPERSPRMIVVEKSLRIGPSPYAKEMSLASTTRLPLRWPVWISSLAWPVCSRRSLR